MNNKNLFERVIAHITNDYLYLCKAYQDSTGSTREAGIALRADIISILDHPNASGMYDHIYSDGISARHYAISIRHIHIDGVDNVLVAIVDETGFYKDSCYLKDWEMIINYINIELGRPAN
jgi:hypothetical protein